MTRDPGRWQSSLAARLVALFSLGSLFIFVLLGVSLVLMLRSELRARDQAEIEGKTALVVYHLEPIRTAADLVRSLPRFVETAVGHANLQLGIRVADHWLLRPEDGVGELLAGHDIGSMPSGQDFATLRDGERTWWVRRVTQSVGDVPGAEAHAIVAIEVSDTQRVEQRLHHAIAMIGTTGILLLAAMAWWAVRRSLAPLERIADDAQRVTAERLGEPLSIIDAPEEVRGVIEGINRMLSRLDDSFRSLEQFSADIAHELRTPLNSLMLNVEVTLSRERTADEYREALLGTMSELDHLHRMVSDMLFIARAERGMAVVAHEPLALLEEARAVVEYLEPLASERRLNVVVEGEAQVDGDRSMIRRAIVNLVSNAVRYSFPGSVVSVNITRDERSVTLAVRNRCEPLVQSQIDHLFDRFTRSERARARQPEGAGLGLAIVRSIMASHGGSASARQVDGGLEVVLIWPVSHHASITTS